MATQDDVRRIAMSLPETQELPDRFGFAVGGGAKPKAFAWVWLERVHPKKARVPQPAVLAVRVAGEADKGALLALDPAVFFTEPHYDGYPAILVRLVEIGEWELQALLTDAWRCQAPKRLLRPLGAAGPSPQP